MPETNPRREWALDWLTALLPVALVCVFSYGFAGVVAAVTACGGYLAAAVLCGLATKEAVSRDTVWESVTYGVLTALCLPPAAPVWVAPLAGGAVGTLVCFGAWARRVSGGHRLPLCHPVAAALAVVYCLSAARTGFVLPAQWRGLDAVSAATPLAALGGDATHSLWYLFFGVRGGAMGEICAVAVLITALYLVLKRRVRLIAPACMLATVFLLSWIVWGMPLYAVLAGSAIPAAVLLGEHRFAPCHPAAQAVAGVTAGAVTVWVRAAGAWSEGTALGLVAAGVAVYAARLGWHFACKFGIPARVSLLVKDIFSKIKNKG